MDMSTEYLGLELAHPLVPSACGPLTRTIDDILRLEDAGAPAIILHSLFEEEIVREQEHLDTFLDYGRDSSPEVTSYVPRFAAYRGPDAYFDLLRRAVERVAVPVIGSLNCSSLGAWETYAPRYEEAGASALELNIYHLPTSPIETSSQVETRCLSIVEHLKRRITIPLAVKLHPYFSSLPNMAERLHRAGADALVLFNRFYQPDLDLDELEVSPRLHLSRPADLLLPLRWIAILYGQVPVQLALTSGVHSGVDALKAVAAGASIAMTAAELLEKGPSRLVIMRDEMERWLEKHEYQSIRQMRGSLSQRHVPNPAAFERANYVKALQSYHPDPTAWRI